MPRVLVVDDDEDTRDIVAMVLRSEGYEVITAEDGLQGLECLHSHPDLVLLDMMMPVMDGWDFVQIKNSDAQVSGIPVIVFTALKRRKNEDSIPNTLFILQKPMSLDELLDAVRGAMRDHTSVKLRVRNLKKEK